MRKDGRQNDEMREIKFTRDYTKYAKGSVLVEFGDTKVLVCATVEMQNQNGCQKKKQVAG